MKVKIFLSFVLFLSAVASANAQQSFPFADEIRAFKRQDSVHFPPKNGILFIGSSSIRLWADLEKRFPGKPIIKRGVGGSQLSQLVDYYTPYILLPYQPRKVFIYAGENDIASGKSAGFVAAEFKKLWEIISGKLPGAQIYYMSIKLSPSRSKHFSEITKANNLIKNYLTIKPNSTYIDVATIILKTGTAAPDSSLFKADYLHLNTKGYDRWQTVLAPFVN